ncbi:MAG: S41 family peptidase [Firmicutes bacterium]|nr:S41 family peptidase [Bacillota bacterium]
MRYIIWKVKNAFSNWKYKVGRTLSNIKHDLKKVRKILYGFVIIAAVMAVAITVTPIIWREVQCRQNKLTRQEILYDFDYLLTAIEENFPFLGMLYRRDGVDLLAIGQEVRTQIAEETTTMCIRDFWNVLQYDFLAYAEQIGHLHLLHEPRRVWMVDNFNYMNADMPEGSYLARWWSVVSNPPTHPCYSRINFREQADSRRQMLSTEIIKDGEIAYIRFYHFSGWMNVNEQSEWNKFNSGIANFNHLIIDLRGNRGGNLLIYEHAIRPLLTRSLIIQINYFYKGGSYNVNFFNLRGLFNRHDVVRPTIRRPFCVDNINKNVLFSIGNVNYDVLRDLSYFDYMGSGYRVVRSFCMRTQQEFISPFSGKIWMLVDEYVFSAANQAAALSKYSGFATLVGETTGGISGNLISRSSEYFILPNTGIIVRYDPAYVTNRYGHPLEYGILPHVFNRPGLCALETVLELISEGSY